MAHLVMPKAQPAYHSAKLIRSAVVCHLPGQRTEAAAALGADYQVRGIPPVPMRLLGDAEPALEKGVVHALFLTDRAAFAVAGRGDHPAKSLPPLRHAR